MKKQILVLLSVIIFSFGAFAQQAADTLVLSRQEAEATFLQRNLQLIASRLDIQEAEAQVIQAKLWPNPTLSVGEINLWSNPSAEQLPYLAGTWGNTSQIAVEVEQLILTAGKRNKLVAMEQVGVEMAKQYFEDLLRSLKVEFRMHLTNLQFLQYQLDIYQQQLGNIRQLLRGYQNQYQQGNVSQREYLRLKASELDFVKSINEWKRSRNELERELKALMGLPAQLTIVLTEEGFLPDLAKLEGLNPVALIDTALSHRPDLRAANLETDYFTKKLTYERALRSPDVSLQANYDRGGNIMYDFVGFGISMDLPFFHKNQGNIKAAGIAVDRSKLLAEEKSIRIQAEIIQVYDDLRAAVELYEGLDASYEEELERLLVNHHRNFLERNISMLEYLDFLEAYLSSKHTILSTKKELNDYYEGLQYSTGIAF